MKYVVLSVSLFIFSILNSTGVAAQDKPSATASPGPLSKTCPARRGSARARTQGRDATPEERSKLMETFRRSPTARSFMGQFSMSTTQAAATRKNVTRHSYDPKHGNQVSYSTADGQIYLWYPGNSVILKGEWRACEDTFGVTAHGSDTVVLRYGVLCFRYGTNTANPVTGVKGNEWQCGAAGMMEASFVSKRDGDIFGLSKAIAVPFPLMRDKTSIDQLLFKLPTGRKT